MRPFLKHVRHGSWPCKNTKTRDGDRRSYSSKTALTVKRASELNLPNDPKNVILAAFLSFAFLHSQGHWRRFGREPAFPLYPINRHRYRASACLKCANSGNGGSRL